MNPVFDELYTIVKGDYTAAIAAQEAVWLGKKPDHQPLLLTLNLSEEQSAHFPAFTPSEVHFDQEKMLLDETRRMACVAQAGMDSVPSARANMGCGIFPSLFTGIVPMLFDDDKMPWVQTHLSLDEIASLREEDIVVTDEFRLALEHMAHIAEKLSGTGAFVYPLDLQGPFDMAHIIYGDAFFYDIYDEPELMHHLLRLCCHAIELGVDECLKVMPRSDEYIAHYNGVVIPRALGGFKISEDTSTLVSAEHLDEFVMPYTTRVLTHTKGGYIHYCGRNDALLDRVLAHPMVHGLNFGNPEKHDMESVLKRVVKAGKVFYGDTAKHADETEDAFFERSLRAAMAEDGLCKLLLVYNGRDFARKDEVHAAWARACAKVGL